MTTDDIKTMSIYMIDKDGNGYIGPVPEEVFPIVAKFVKFVKVNRCQFEMVGIENFVLTDNSKQRDSRKNSNNYENKITETAAEARQKHGEHLQRNHLPRCCYWHELRI